MRFRFGIVWLLLLVLVGGIVWAEQSGYFASLNRVDEHGHIVTPARMLLPVAVDQLSAVEVSIADVPHRFERDNAGAWFYHAHANEAAENEPHEHVADPAQAALIDQALGVLGRTRIAREVGTGAQGENYGVTQPNMIISVFADGQTRPVGRYMVGDLEPDELRRYVLIFGAFSIVTIPNYQVENLRQLVAAVSADQP